MSDMTRIGPSLNLPQSSPSEDQVTKDDANQTPQPPLTAGIGGIKDEIHAQSLNTFDSIFTADPPVPDFQVDIERRLSAFEQIPSVDDAGKLETVKNAQSEAISRIISAFKTSFQAFADDKEKFHELMGSAFNNEGQVDLVDFSAYGLPNPYSEDKVEALRQRALAGDYTWLPQIQFVAGSAVNGTNGGYSEGPPGTVYLNKALVNRPEQAEECFIRAVGFQLEQLTYDPDVFQQGKELAKQSDVAISWGSSRLGLSEFYAEMGNKSHYWEAGGAGEFFRQAFVEAPAISVIQKSSFHSANLGDLFAI